MCKGDEEVVVAIELPPSPPAVNPTSPTRHGEKVDDDPSGLPNDVDSGYEPIVSTTFGDMSPASQDVRISTCLYTCVIYIMKSGEIR